VQVTALLGPNGAGKSTIMAMLTGMLTPSSGLVMVDGLDVSRSIGRVRQSLGVCPQHDILWPVLTVQEHLRLYAALRGYERASGAAAATAAAENVGLLDKLHCPAHDLSGGQRRRLSVAISFLGNPRVVVCCS
jgi:ABC-type multidrug transport system ATPase subunit